MELPGRGTVFVRDSAGPPESPVLLLFHGWLATADLNWGFSYPALAKHFRVIAFDQRGHGRGLRGNGRFDLGTCAHDGVAVLDALGIDRAIAVGYSMGGPIALSLAHEHGDRVRGLVLCATAGSFSRSPFQRATLAPLSPLIGATRIVPDLPIRRMLRRRFISRRATGVYRDWIADELVPSDLAAVAQAGIALGRFDGLAWAGELATPAVSVVTIDDELVKPAAQYALARAVGADPVFAVAGGHTTCFDHPDQFTPVLVDACVSVAERRGGGRSGPP